MRFKHWLLLCLVVVLSACGGGGGGASVSSSADSLSFDTYEGLRTASQTIDVSLDSGSGRVYASAYSDSLWMQASLSLTGETTGRITVTPDPQLPAGTYHGNVRLGLCSDALCQLPHDSKTFAVTMVVRPGLHASHSSMTFGGFEGSLTPGQPLSVTLPDLAGTLQIDAVDGSLRPRTWIASTPSGAKNYLISADCTTLVAGYYTGSIRLTYLRADGGPSLVTMLPFTISVGPGLVQPANRNLRLDYQSSTASIADSVPIAYNGTGHFAWTATSSQPWLKLITASGSTPSSLTYRVDLTEAQKLRNFTDHTATVTVSAHGTSDMKFDVVLSKALPEVTGAMPYALRTGKPTRVLMGGQGFTQAGHPELSLRISGLTPLSVQVLSDRQLSVDLPATAAGWHDVILANPVGVSTYKSQVVFADSSGLAYSVVPAPGIKGRAIFDAPRQTIFSINATLGKIMRMRQVGGSWQTDELALPNAKDLTLSADGRKLLVTHYVIDLGGLHSTFGFNVIDPDTFTLEVTDTTPYGGYVNPFGMAVTNDGRVWIPSFMRYWDPVNQTLIDASCPASSPHCGNEEMAAPPDGSFIYINQVLGISPPPDMLEYNALTGLVTAQPGMNRVASRQSLSTDGSKGFALRNVYDTGFSIIGTVNRTMSAESIVNEVMSQDGTRIFQLISKSGNFVRIDIFDAAAAGPDVGLLPLIGSITLTDAAGACTHTASTLGPCDERQLLLVSPDGSTLFWLAEKNMIVIPVPVSMRATVMQEQTRSRLGRMVIFGR
jgi:hypothetical protein